jgi:7-cyano-7-deazaguanine synthase
MQKAVVLMSGGVNSAVAAAIAREQYEPALLHVAWGHRSAARELACIEQLATALKIETTCVAELPCLATFGAGARVNRRQGIEDASTLGQRTPGTFTQGLLQTMLGLATAWASTIGAKRIFVGITEDHHVSGPAISELYPDYRREFVQVSNLLLHYAIPQNRELIIEAPLLEIARAEVVRLGGLMGVPFDKTWSCYVENESPCGRCRACVTRANGFIQAKIPDPLLLEPATR